MLDFFHGLPRVRARAGKLPSRVGELTHAVTG